MRARHAADRRTGLAAAARGARERAKSRGKCFASQVGRLHARSGGAAAERQSENPVLRAEPVAETAWRIRAASAAACQGGAIGSPVCHHEGMPLSATLGWQEVTHKPVHHCRRLRYCHRCYPPPRPRYHSPPRRDHDHLRPDHRAARATPLQLRAVASRATRDVAPPRWCPGTTRAVAA
eukprot:scaffold1496_cov110-Isochrysis_galbana.AAC.7